MESDLWSMGFLGCTQNQLPSGHGRARPRSCHKEKPRVLHTYIRTDQYSNYVAFESNDIPINTYFHVLFVEMYTKRLYTYSSKEVWKLNFRQYGKMEMAQQGRNSDVEKVRSEKIRDGEDQRWRKSEERRCRCAKR